MPRLTYGTRKLGVLVPSGNSVAEPELLAMLPSSVTMLGTRLPLCGSSDAELAAMLTGLEQAAALVGDAQPEVIAFHCTAVSTFAPHLAGDIRARIEAATRRTAITTADGILAAFRALRTRSVLLVTPYLPAVHQREIDYLATNGLTVTGGSYLALNTNAEMALIEPDAIVAQVREAVAAEGDVAPADACFISCTAIRSAGVIEELEAAIGMPVITSNQVLAWYALRTMGITDRGVGFGALFDHMGG